MNYPKNTDRYEESGQHPIFHSLKKILPGRQTILIRSLVLSLIVILLTLTIFVAAIIPAQNQSLIRNMKIQALSVASSIKEITVSSIAVEDYSTVVDICNKVLQERPSILYIVVTRLDGTSNIFTKERWVYKKLSGMWVPKPANLIQGAIIRSNLVNKRVFHYSYSMKYSGIVMGWIHIGLSVKNYDLELASAFRRTFIIALISLIIGLIAAFFFAKRMSDPIRQIITATRLATAGDLSVRVQVQTGDEIEELAGFFNQMTESLQKSHINLEKRVEQRTRELKKTNILLKKEIQERELAEQEIRKLSQAVESTPAAICLIDMEGKIVYANPGMMTMSQVEDEKFLIGRPFSELLDDEQNKWVKEKINQVLKENGKWSGEFRINRMDGSSFPSEMIASVIYDRENKPKYYLAHYYDISVLKEAQQKLIDSLKDKEILLKEIHHRVKNNLQIISSLLYLQSRNITDHTLLEIFNESQNRIKSMALIHEKLYQSTDLSTVNFPEYLKSLITYLQQSYRASVNKVKIKVDVDAIHFDLDQAIPCGLIINELVSNSMKYAFKSDDGPFRGEEPLIRVALKKRKENFLLIVEDNGKGIPEEVDYRKTESLGLKLVYSLTEQLEGKIAFYRDHGTRFEITFAD